MRVFLNSVSAGSPYEQLLQLQKKLDSDEEIVRVELVRVWTRILEKYARPGARIPAADMLRKELLEAGVEAAVQAVVDEHWFVFSFMIRNKIQEKVREGLDRCDLARFCEDVVAAQNDPGLLRQLREMIRRAIID